MGCEDLGGTFDWDFNDVVFGVSHVAGEDHATVTALASGGTLPVYIYSKYPQLKGTQEITNPGNILIPNGTGDGEFHKWWGATRPSYAIINASNWGAMGNSVTVKVDPDTFTMSTAGDPKSYSQNTLDADGNMGGFKVIVKKDGGDTTTITPPVYNADYEAPQMFLVPDTWKWPREMQDIRGVYLDFVEFKANWWTNPNGPQKDNIINHSWSHPTK